MTAVPYPLTKDFIALCEGLADKNFIRKLCAKRDDMPAFDLLPNEELHGNKAFGKMLEALLGDQIQFKKIRGILIIADRMDIDENNPTALFGDICSQIASVGGFGIPEAPLELGTAEGYPPVSIMFLPDEATPGGLETLLAEEMAAKYPDITVNACVDSFMHCDKITAYQWPAEKHSKARFHSMVAVLNYDDPSKSASSAFRDPEPMIDVTSPRFDAVAQRLKDFEIAVIEWEINSGG